MGRKSIPPDSNLARKYDTLDDAAASVSVRFASSNDYCFLIAHDCWIRADFTPSPLESRHHQRTPFADGLTRMECVPSIDRLLIVYFGEPTVSLYRPAMVD